MHFIHRMPLRLGLLIYLSMVVTAACQPSPASTTPLTSAPTAIIATMTPDETELGYIETNVSGVRMRVDIPEGWEAKETNDGVLMAEWLNRVGSPSPSGMQVHLFVRSMDDFKLPSEDHINVAWSVLNQIIRDPSLVGDGAATEPQGFEWDGMDAAYYLMNTGDGSVTLLIAVSLKSPLRLIVCNISSPNERSHFIRFMLPQLLHNLTINGSTLDISAVEVLPNPLVFPDYETPEAKTKSLVVSY